jgi:hypothetical protein
MDLQKHKTLYIVIIAALALLIASPALQKVLVYPQTSFYTEFSLLDSNHATGFYPYNINPNTTYTVYLDLSNHLGTCEYYTIEVKFRNETQPEADPFLNTPSPQQSLYNITAFVANKEAWESPINFSFDYTNQTVGNTTQVNFKTLNLNNIPINLNDYTSTWNFTSKTYYGSLSLELWRYENATQDFQYDQRYLSLRFNMTLPNPQP